MKKFLCWVMWLGLMAQPIAATEVATSPLDPLASFVGGVWIAEVPGPGGRVMQIEARYEWAENKKAIKFESAFIADGKRAPYVSGFYAWNAAKKSFSIYYADASGTLVEGTMTQVGENEFKNELTATTAAGKLNEIRVTLTKVGENVFNNDIYTPKDGEWSRLLLVRYERKP